MTDTTNKLRAVFLTALMIGSVFAAGIAFSGSVAAASNTSISASPNTAEASAMYTITTTVDGSKDTDYLTFDIPGADYSNVGDGDVSLDDGENNVTSSGVSVSNGALQVTLGQTADLNSEQVTVKIRNVVNPTSTQQATLEFKSTTQSQTWDTASDTVSITDSSGNPISTQTRDHDSVFNSPATVFLGEEGVDISDVTSGGSATLAPTGDTGTSVVVDNTSSVDFTSTNGFDAGATYNVSGNSDGQGDISVRSPNINDLTLDQGSAEITNARAQPEQPIKVTPEFNFDSADHLAVTVTDSSGLDVTNTALSTGNGLTQDSDGDWYYSGDSGTSFTINTNQLDKEQYNVTVEGDELDASYTVSFTVGDSDTSISLDNTEVTKGQPVIATVTGAPGEKVDVSVEEDALANSTNVNDADAKALFANTGDVNYRKYNSDEQSVYANLSLGDDGQAQVRLQTQELESDTTATIEVAPNVTASEDDSVDLRINEQSITINSAPSSVAVRGQFTINGSAPEVDQVGAYVKLEDTWYPVHAQSGGDNLTDVEDDGTFELELIADDDGNALEIPGSYRIGVAASPPTSSGELQNIDQSDWGDYTTASTTIQTGEGNLTAAFERSYLATGEGIADENTLSGHAIGQSSSQVSDVYVYAVGPRGTLKQYSPTIEDDNTYEQSIQSDNKFYNSNGQYKFIIVGAGRDGTYDSTNGNQVSPSGTQSQVIDVIRDEHTGAGSDDVIVNTTLNVQEAQISIDQSGELEQEVVQITGTTNRAPDTTFFVDVTDSSGQSVTSTEAEVHNNGTWTAQLDLTQVELGSYTLSVEGDDASATQSITVVEAQQQTTQQPTTAQPTTAQPTTAQPTTAQPTTAQPTTAQTTAGTTGGSGSSGSGIPGFGMGIALVAVLGAALLALRQN